MRKINNPYKDLPGYNCFGCSPFNKIGLKMEFYEEGDFIVCDWKPDGVYQGYFNVLHGGIQATLLDEIASWVIMIKLKTAGVTARMSTRYRKPVNIEQKSSIKLKANLIESNRRSARIKAVLYNSDGVIATEAEVEYFLFTEDEAKGKLMYPGIDKFFDET